jgi:hypothetical protein
MSQLRRKQLGLNTVEFSIVGLLVFIVMFGAIEMGRMLFTLNVLREATYRGARMAVVCTPNNPAVARAAVFNSSGGGTNSPILPNLTTDNIEIEYLAGDGTVLTNPASDPAQFVQIRYIRVQIVNYTHDFFLPGASFSFAARSYPVTLPKESLGIPRPGQTTTCT